ncbi:MAG TPA: hypothetical protein VKD90_17365 [Gemmataceae bacterium]|nr:hypothetical protein [Gemmataceae bacterium]
MRRLLLGLAPACLVLAGCSGNSLPPQTESAEGREVLKTVLDGWVAGRSMEEMKAGKPAVVAYDPDWEAGHRLTKYVVGATDGRAGVDLLLSVKLHLDRKDGKSQEKTVNFCVAIGSQTVVTRKQ